MGEKLPKGYFADYQVKRQYEKKKQEQKEWRKNRDEELERKHDLKRDKRGDLLCIRCDEFVVPTDDSMRSVKCEECGRRWFEKDD